MLINHIYNGDSLYVLQELDENSIDAVVTDPPYGISFMGKKWDYDVPSVELWKEVLRVLKPGGHALVACGTRTQHRMAVNLEDAGFEIRDLIAWIYGSGFPKSLNIGKAVDKLMGGNGKWNVENEEMEMSKFSEKITQRKFIRKDRQKPNPVLYLPEHENAKQFEGFGTALKPAMELWTLCRKPISEKNIAENVLKHGTGGINIDGCRVEIDGNDINQRPNGSIPLQEGGKTSIFKMGGRNSDIDGNTLNMTLGRFPANVILDGSEEVLAGFPETKNGGMQIGQGNGNHTLSEWTIGGKTTIDYSDSGSAARFFYTAKASKSERNAGLDGFEEKRNSDNGRKENSKSLLHSTNGELRKFSNFHPTVKPISLMRYLCKLITPPNGVVLDCFCGSGTTGAAAILEGFDFIGIERDSEYVEIARARINDKRNLFKQEIF